MLVPNSTVPWIVQPTRPRLSPQSAEAEAQKKVRTSRVEGIANGGIDRQVDISINALQGREYILGCILFVEDEGVT